MVNKILEPLLCNRSRHAWCDAGPHHRSDYVSTCSRVRVAHRTGHGKSGPFWWRYLADTRTSKTTFGYRHFDDVVRQRVARIQGLFLQEDGPNGPRSPDFPSTGRVM